MGDRKGNGSDMIRKRELRPSRPQLKSTEGLSRVGEEICKYLASYSLLIIRQGSMVASINIG
jgi:hypothetical protein